MNTITFKFNENSEDIDLESFLNEKINKHKCNIAIKNINFLGKTEMVFTYLYDLKEIHTSYYTYKNAQDENPSVRKEITHAEHLLVS